MDIQEAKKFATNKIEADALTKQVRDIIKITKCQKQNMRDGFKETFNPLIESQDSVKKSIDKQQDSLIKQLQANQLALTQGLNQNRLAITEGFDKMDEVKRWELSQLPGFEAIEEPKEHDGVLPATSEEGLKIAKFKAEDLDRYLKSKESQDILKINEYYKLPSEYFKEDVSTIDKVIADVNEDLEELSKAMKNTADFVRDANGYNIAQPKSKKPREETLNYIKNYNILSIYARNLSDLKYYKTKSGSGTFYFNNPQELLKRLELLSGSLAAGNNGVLSEYIQIADRLKDLGVVTNNQLNKLLRKYINIR